MEIDIFRLAEQSMTMSDETWGRHANPWSVWTRMTCLPLIAFAIWSRVWLGPLAIPLLGIACFWTWCNPRAFPAPRRTDNWASYGTFGERVFLERRKIDIPRHHLVAANVLVMLSLTGLPPLIYGLWALDFWAVVAGHALMIVPKVWFVDRMVWIFHDFKATDTRYRSWVRFDTEQKG